MEVNSGNNISITYTNLWLRLRRSGIGEDELRHLTDAKDFSRREDEILP